ERRLRKTFVDSKKIPDSVAAGDIFGGAFSIAGNLIKLKPKNRMPSAQRARPVPIPPTMRLIIGSPSTATTIPMTTSAIPANIKFEGRRRSGSPLMSGGGGG